MFNLLKDFYIRAEALKGKRLFYTISIIFLVFILTGVLIGYFMTPKLSRDEMLNLTEETTSPSDPKKYYEGRISYVNPQLYPLDDISYALLDSSGKEIFLIKSIDEKLAIAEGLFVKVSGRMGKLRKAGHRDISF